MTKQTLVLNDEPLLHLALSLILDKQPEVTHLSSAAELEAKISEKVGCVVVDRAAKGIDLVKIADLIRKKAPRAGIVVLGKKSAVPAFPETQILFTEELYSQREKISAFIAEYSREK